MSTKAPMSSARADTCHVHFAHQPGVHEIHAIHNPTGRAVRKLPEMTRTVDPAMGVGQALAEGGLDLVTHPGLLGAVQRHLISDAHAVGVAFGMAFSLSCSLTWGRRAPAQS